VPRGDGRIWSARRRGRGLRSFDNRRRGAELFCNLALSLAPQLAAAQVERSWAGLRPATADGLPFLGRVPGLENAFVGRWAFSQRVATLDGHGPRHEPTHARPAVRGGPDLVSPRSQPVTHDATASIKRAAMNYR